MLTSWIRSKSKEILFAVLTAFFLFLILEGLAFLYNHFKVKNEISEMEFRYQKPPPYSNSLYFSKRFITSSLNSGGIFYTPEGTRLILAKNYATDFINVENGDRVTFPKTKARNKIYIFGGSTIYSGEVPDFFTIPSLLKQIILKNDKKDYDVINKGVTSINVAQQNEYLKTIILNKGDIVIYYDGVNDILQGLFFGNADGTIIGEQKIISEQKNNEKKLNKFLLSSNIFKLLQSLIANSYTPEHLIKNSQKLTEAREQVSAQYIKKITEARDYTEKNGARFMHFLQPNLFTVNKPSLYESRVVKERVFHNLPLAFEYGNEVLRAANLQLEKNGVETFDITDVFDGKLEECFLDGYHVTEFCNALVANRIYKNINNAKKISEPTREYLNNIYKTYLVEKKLDYLSSSYIPKNIELIKKTTKFDDLFANDSKGSKKIIGGELADRFILISHLPMNFYQIITNFSCEGDSTAFLTFNNENKVLNKESHTRVPLKCGETITNYRVPYNPSSSGFVIEATGKIYLHEITLNKLID